MVTEVPRRANYDLTNSTERGEREDIYESSKHCDSNNENRCGKTWWYQFYFATDRGQAGYDKYRHDFAKLIWQLASPKWNFDDATFDRSAASFENPDHVAITIHNYRWRQGLAEGEAKYDDLEKRLAAAPVIGVPTITLEGDANGAPHPDPSSYAKKFSGRYANRIVTGGIGHNLPQEAPQAFAQAIVDVDSYSI